MRALAFGIVIGGAIGTAAAAEPLQLSDVQLDRIRAGLTDTEVSVTSISCVNGSCSVSTSETSTSETSTSETRATASALPVSANAQQWQLAFGSAWLQQLVSIQAHR